MKRIFSPFRGLQWKLTLSYAMITMMTLLVIAFIVLMGLSEFIAAHLPQLEINTLKQQAPEIAPYLLTTAPDQIGIAKWLQRMGDPTTQAELSSVPQASFTLSTGGFTIVVDREGQVVASRGSKAVRPGALLQKQLTPEAASVIQAALKGHTDFHLLTMQTDDGMMMAAFPIMNEQNNVVGALVVQQTGLDQASLLLGDVRLALILAIPLTLLVTISGIIFAFFTSRSFSRRFRRLAFAVERWGRGNFSAFAVDRSGDELGQLTRQLNAMAGHLHTLLQTSQQFAILEERNRLARDLHDSVKQQVFTISMLVNTSKGMLRRDLDQAQASLDEVDSLVCQVQQELASLVHELRPIALEGKGLIAALQELALVWMHQTDIAIEVQIHGEPGLSLRGEEALFRITQEALANVARHSQATAVKIDFTCERDAIKLSICDNGQGFDLASVKGGGVGLLSMQERMKALGGELLVKSVPGKGTQIEVRCENAGLGVQSAGVS